MGFRLVPMETGAHKQYFWRSVGARSGRFPYPLHTPEDLEAMVRFELKKPDAQVRIIVTEEDPDAFAGCLAWRPGFIVHAFVTEELQRQGLMRWALGQAEITRPYMTGGPRPDGRDQAQPYTPLPVLIWSATATRIAAKGWRIYPAIPFQKETP